MQGGQRSVRARDLHDLAGQQSSHAGEDDDLALLQEARKPPVELVDDLVLAVLADAELDDGLAGLDAEFLRPFDAAEHGRRLEELLRGHATPVQAGTANLVLLHDGDREPGRPHVQSRRVPARPAPDDNYVELRRFSLARWQNDHLLGSTMMKPPDRPHAGGRSLLARLCRLSCPA